MGRHYVFSFPTSLCSFLDGRRDIRFLVGSIRILLPLSSSYLIVLLLQRSGSHAGATALIYWCNFYCRAKTIQQFQMAKVSATDEQRTYKRS